MLFLNPHSVYFIILFLLLFYSDFPSSKDIALMADGIDPLNDYLHIALHLDIGTVEADAISPTETSLKNRFIKLIEYWKKWSKGLTLEEKHQHIRQIIPQVIYQELYGNREEVCKYFSDAF